MLRPVTSIARATVSNRAHKISNRTSFENEESTIGHERTEGNGKERVKMRRLFD